MITTETYESLLTEAKRQIAALKAENARLQAAIDALRQPCAHQGTEADCPYCHVRQHMRELLRSWVSTGHAAAALKIYDAACQVVREGQR